MSRAPRPLLPGARAAGPPTYEMLKEEHEVVVLGSGAPQSAAPATTTVINICGDTVVPDHVVWSLFNTIFLNSFCLGFVAFVYSVKVGGCGPGPPPRVPTSGTPTQRALGRTHVRVGDVRPV